MAAEKIGDAWASIWEEGVWGSGVWELTSAGSGVSILCGDLPGGQLIYEIDANNGASAMNAGGFTRYGQTFTAPASPKKITKVCFKANVLNGSPTGDFTAKIYALTGTIGVNATPTGAALATSVTLTDLAELGLTEEWIGFAFDWTPAASTSYGASIELGGGSTDVSNRPGVWTSAGADAGQNAFRFDGTWAGLASTDADIRVYQEGGDLMTNVLDLTDIITTI